MIKDYQRIKEMRTDISEFVLHCTKEHYRPVRGSKECVSPFEALKLMLEDGFLKATHAWVQVKGSGTKPTIRGPYPAVCFTDQPVRFFLQSIKASKEMTRDRYTEFGVAVKKVDLYRYGGRPVIYSDERILGEQLNADELTARQLHLALLVYKNGLPEEFQHLWAHYNPLRREKRRPRPVDFTHEREWRARPDAERNKDIELTEEPDKVVPIQLATGDRMIPTDPRFLILVDTEKRKEELAEWIEGTSGQIRERRHYWWRYGLALASVAKRGHILSFERVEIESREPSMCRIEDFITIAPEGTNGP